MRLPDGVFHRPRQKELAAINRPAIVEIATDKFPGNEKYKINDRLFNAAIAPFLRGDLEDLDRVYCLKPRRTVKVEGKAVELTAVYSGAEYNDLPKKPNITVVPNLQVAELRGMTRPILVLGCTMGHRHVGDFLEPHIQEIYEFQSYGLIVIDREEGEVEAWVAQDGDKVSVPSACHMTLYNLGDEDHPLITLDFANPKQNKADKKTAEEIGPVLLGHYDDLEVVFTVNHLHCNNPKHKAGVRLHLAPGEMQDRQIRISRVGRLDLGAFLYEQLTQNSELIGRFAKLGVRIRRASPEAYVGPFRKNVGSRTYFSRPLVDAVRPGTDIYDYFIPGCRKAEPGHPDAVGILGRESQAAREKQRLGQPKLHHKHVIVVVEGAGAWVTQAYRPLFEKLKVPGKRLSVFYADDTRWKAAPEWADKLRKNETYLDKSDPDDFALYRNLIPDVVFLVTPDLTHSAIAREWLDRKAPLVFVEKPFDSQLGNVEALFNALGRNPVMTVLGLDHYQFRAHRIREILPDIIQHLGGALARLDFYMTEIQPLELDRIRTLQYGLTLDMLPHFFALLAFFGDIGSIDDVQVLDAGRYGPEFKAAGKDKEGNKIEEDVTGQFHNETYLKVRFTFEDYSGNGYRVPCTAVVGKGFKSVAKYLEITGRSGNAIRIEFSGVPKPDPAPGYPWGQVMFLFADASDARATVVVNDPHRRERKLRIGSIRRPVEESKERYYQSLVDDLFSGRSNTLGSTLLPREAWEVVRGLDRIWWAIQVFRDEHGWSEQLFQQTDPIEFGEGQSESER